MNRHSSGYDTVNTAQLSRYRQETAAELQVILSWWSRFMPDEIHGGFFGSVNNDNEPDRHAPKGLVLNSRILWAFSAGYLFSGDIPYLTMASRAFHYIQSYFTDKEYGGLYWSVTATGQPADTRKQIYGLAFCIYGMSAYYKATQIPEALSFAIELFHCIEQHSPDKINNGYTEAFARDWSLSGDMRLSEKDDNESKTMNTHLHIVEAYASLYEVWKDEQLRNRINNLLWLCDRHFINKQTGHLHLFFDDNWQLKSTLQSYGHDIEAAWLLLQCAEAGGDTGLIQQFSSLAIQMTDAAAEAQDADGGLWYEYDPVKKQLIKEKHAWPQAEAMIGFFNAWQLSGHEKYLQFSLRSWQFIKEQIKDKEKGEWFWGVKEDYGVMPKEKAGFWKCPYHSSRACIEINRRITESLK